MRSARRRALIEKKKRTNSITGFLAKVILPITLVLIFISLLLFGRKYWDGQNKLAFAYRQKDGNVAVSVLDPRLVEETTLIIPGDTQVDVARNLGTIRIKNVWQLGINEKIGGKLLSETITQNFFFPVFLWSDKDVQGLTDGKISDIIHFVLIPTSTNIPFGDRVSIALFSFKVSSIGKTTLDLGKSQFLSKTKLSDGQSGYILTGPVSSRLTVYFSDNQIIENLNSGKSLRVQIEDSTGAPGVAENVGQIVEVMGGKVIAINKKSEGVGDCTILGPDIKLIRKIADIFFCKTKVDKSSGDIDILLGKDFAKRY